MAQVNKIDSNATALAYAEELSIGVLPVTPIWIPLEPNSYDDFGGEVTTVARSPINSSRQRKKGVVTDLDAAGSFPSDLTQENAQDLMQGFMFADFRRKGEETPTEATGTTDLFDVASTTGFFDGSLIFVTGFVNSANNGLHEITAIVTDVTIEVLGSTLITETPPATANIVNVGFQGAAGDIDVSVAGDYPALTSTALDFTTLGLIVGEMIFIGGDSASLAFSNSENNGIKRIRSIAANSLELDKSVVTMVTEASTTETVQLFFGRVLKNEVGSTIVRRSYQLERQLGAPDDASPAQIQSEYIVGAVPSEITFNIPTADKITIDMGFMGTDHEQRTGVTGIKSGTRQALVEADAYNTSSDFSRIKMAQVVANDEAPSALFVFITELTLVVNNNLSQNKAVSVLGSFDVTEGFFDVTGNLTAYFGNISAIQAVRNNSDVTLDLLIAKDNAGIAMDVPLISLGDGKVDVEANEPVTLPISMAAATGIKNNANMDHTLLIVFFDFLPTAAE